jgi:hypothetical protein
MARVEKYNVYIEVVSNYNGNKKVAHRVNDPKGDHTIPVVTEQIDATIKKHREYLQADKNRTIVRTKISIDTIIG